MENLPLFPRALRLIIYAGGTIAALASVPTIVAHARQAVMPTMEDESNTTQISNSPVLAHHEDGTISIQRVQSDAAARRKAELVTLQAKLATIRSSK